REERPMIRPEFPPKIKAKDLIIRPENGSKPPRAPNAFIIYRKIFVETARADGYHLPMTTVSSMASRSWVEESEEVRSYYKRLAKDAYNYRSKIYPKIERQKKRKRWNIVSFPSESSLNARPSQTTTEFLGSSDEQIPNQHLISPETRDFNGEISLTSNEFYEPYAFDYQDTRLNSEIPSISNDSSPELINYSILPPLLIHSSPYHALSLQNFDDYNDSAWSPDNVSQGRNKKPNIIQETGFLPRRAVKFDLPKTTRHSRTSTLFTFPSSSNAVAPEQSSSRDVEISFTLLSNNDGGDDNSGGSGINGSSSSGEEKGNEICNNLWSLPWKDENNKFTRKFWFFFMLLAVLLIIFTVGIEVVMLTDP
ncbi:17643_t:CDS:2, partial [Acaulospora colombiana]